MRVKATLEGISPLLMNPATEEMLLAMRGKIRTPKNLDETPREEAERKIYRDPEGNIAFPAENLLSSLVEAGRDVPYQGRKKISTKDSTVLYAFLNIVGGLHLPFKDGEGWKADVRRGTNPNGGEMVCIVRPRFDKWAIDVTLDINDSKVSEEMVRQLVSLAGSQVGLGDFRPSRRGPFGRFEIAAWEVQNGNGHNS